jgi:hypothetical protein
MIKRKTPLTNNIWTKSFRASKDTIKEWWIRFKRDEAARSSSLTMMIIIPLILFPRTVWTRGSKSILERSFRWQNNRSTALRPRGVSLYWMEICESSRMNGLKAVQKHSLTFQSCLINSTSRISISKVNAQTPIVHIMETTRILNLINGPRHSKTEAKCWDYQPIENQSEWIIN